MHVYLFGSYDVHSRGIRRWNVGRDSRRCGGESQVRRIFVDIRACETVSYHASGSHVLLQLHPHRRDPWMFPLFSAIQNLVTVGVSVYEGVAATGTLAVEHTSVAEILAAVAR